MVNLKQFKESVLLQNKTSNNIPDPPAILILRRKYIRYFPGNIKVGMYYASQLNQMITIPLNGQPNSLPVAGITKESLDETNPAKTNNLEILKNISISGTPTHIKFPESEKKQYITTTHANHLLNHYTRLNNSNQKKFEKLLNTQAGYKKIHNFCSQEIH